MPHWLTLGVPPPRPGAPPVEALRFIRAMQVRTLLLTVPLTIALVLLADVPTWLVVAVVAGQLVSVGNALVLTWKISREPG